MEINITQFFNDCNPCNYSASVMELGQNAGKVTWNNALYADLTLLDTPEKLQAMRDWARASGGWNTEEIAAWSDNELNALFIQLIAGDMRENGSDSWPEYEALSQAGQVSGCLFEGVDGEIYYQLEG
jgi:hypothetical protein